MTTKNNNKEIKNIIFCLSFILPCIVSFYYGAYRVNGIQALPGYLIWHGPKFQSGDIIEEIPLYNEFGEQKQNHLSKRKIEKIGKENYKLKSTTSSYEEVRKIRYIDFHYKKIIQP